MFTLWNTLWSWLFSLVRLANSCDEGSGVTRRNCDPIAYGITRLRREGCRARKHSLLLLSHASVFQWSHKERYWYFDQFLFIMTQKQSKRRPKSWKGCTICRAAKRKCTEEQPRCAHCQRNGLDCQVQLHFQPFWQEYDINVRFRVEEFVTENDQVVGQKSKKIGLPNNYSANW